MNGRTLFVVMLAAVVLLVASNSLYVVRETHGLRKNDTWTEKSTNELTSSRAKTWHSVSP